MKIKRVVVRQYRGIEECDVHVGASGAVVRGKNGSGKTTLLNAIRAALEGRDISADAIRKGASKSEILVDLDDISVRRAITPKGNTLAVSREGMLAKAPQTFLRELLGASSLDPMDLLTKRGKERRACVLAALPVQVTVEQLRQYVPRIADDFDCSGHGLEVIERVRAKAYDQRTEANKDAKAKKVEMERLEAEAKGLVAPEQAPDLAPLETAAEKARAELSALRTRKTAAEEQTRKTAEQRDWIKERRDNAAEIRANAGQRVSLEALDQTKAEIDRFRREVTRLREELEIAESGLKSATDLLQSLKDTNASIDSAIKEATDIERQASQLEAALSKSAIEPVTQVQIEEAVGAEYWASEALASARVDAWKYAKAEAARKAADAARKAWDEAAAEAGRLDGIVRALTEDAPKALLAACDGIPGLALDGDDVLLDGVRLDALCGAEQVRFCVEVARRANAKSRILIVDGLERIDEDQRDVFVRAATRDGYQLLATVVQRGEITIEAIQPEAEVEAAE